jgi:hypothetical protein
LHHLDGWSASLSSEEIVILSLYMIGRSERTVSPTICFISESDRYRKEARNVIKESGILKKHPNFKTAHMSKDPGWGEELEQLASFENPDQIFGGTIHGREVFYDCSKMLRTSGLPVYVLHDLKLRAATANAVRLHDRIFYLTSAHMFFDRPPRPSAPAIGAVLDAEFEIDSDNDSDYDAEVNASMTSIGSQSTGSRSSYNLSLESGESSSFSAVVPVHSFNRPTPPIMELATLVESGGVDRNFPAVPPLESSVHVPSFPSQEFLLLLGKVSDYSIDQDWALIEVHPARVPELQRQPHMFPNSIKD